MKSIFAALFSFFLWLPAVQAQEDAYSYMDTDKDRGETLQISPDELEDVLNPSPEEEQGEDDNDPLEPINRVTFGINNFFDDILFDPIAAMYSDIVPEFFRERVGYFLRNLSEPIVLVNNVLDRKSVV